MAMLMHWHFYFIRYSAVDFKDFVESAFDGIPPYGYVFAVELNQKCFRAIRIDSEVNSIVSHQN